MAQGGAVGFRAGARRFSEQWPYLRYLGLGAWWGWIWLCYSSTSLFVLWDIPDLNGVVGLMYLYSTPAIALMCILAAVFWRKATYLLANRPLIVTFGALAAGGTALVAYSLWAGGDAGFAAGAVFTGVGTSALCLKTGSVFGTLGRREVLTAGCVSLVFASFLYFMGIGLPWSWRPAFTALLPLASAFLYIMPSDDPFAVDEPDRPRKREGAGTKAFVCLTLASVMVAATAGFAKGLVAGLPVSADFAFLGPASTFCIFLGALGICFLVNCGDVARAVRLAYAALIVLGVVVVLLSVFGLNLGFLSVGKELLWMLFTCLMAYMVFRFDFSPVRAFGLGQAAYYVASALAWWFGMLMADALSSDSAKFAVAAVMIVAIVLVFAFVFSDADLKFILTWRHADALSDAAPIAQAVSSDCPKAAPDSSCARALACEGPAQGDAGMPAGREPQGGRPLVSAASAASPLAKGDSLARDDAGLPDVLHKYVPPRELSLSERIDLIDPRFGVSVREREIMGLFAQGRSANWIAEELVISKNTVRSHLRSIYTKLDVHTRQELLDFLKTVS